MWRRTLLEQENFFSHLGHSDLSTLGACCALEQVFSEGDNEDKDCEEDEDEEDDQEADDSF